MGSKLVIREYKMREVGMLVVARGYAYKKNITT